MNRAYEKQALVPDLWYVVESDKVTYNYKVQS